MGTTTTSWGLIYPGFISCNPTIAATPDGELNIPSLVTSNFCLIMILHSNYNSVTICKLGLI